MRKSVWLLSAGLFALSTPAFAQQTDTDQGAAQPTEGATAEAAAVDAAAVEPDTQTGDIVVTATRRNEALSDVPLAVSAVTAETLEYSGASDIRQLGQVSPSLLVSSTSSEVGRRRGPHPRHRHGRRQPRPRKFGRGVHRWRLSLAHRRRPDRARRARPHRSACAVRKAPCSAATPRPASFRSSPPSPSSRPRFMGS